MSVSPGFCESLLGTVAESGLPPGETRSRLRMNSGDPGGLERGGGAMLSDTKIRSLKPREKAYKLSDDRGLYLLVNPNGSRWWRFKYYFGGKERGISLGVYPDVPLKYAREQREDARQLVARGIDPSVQRRTNKIALENSFKLIAEEWLALQSKKLAEITMSKAPIFCGSVIAARFSTTTGARAPRRSEVTSRVARPVAMA